MLERLELYIKSVLHTNRIDPHFIKKDMCHNTNKNRDEDHFIIENLNSENGTKNT